MKLQFVEQTLRDFKAFSGTHTIRWDAPGVTFVRGENLAAKRLAANGAAKSTLWDALCWCLTGRTPGNLRNPDVEPWNKSGHPWVCEVVQVDGKTHEIVRSVSPNKLLLDGKEVGQDSIEELVGFGFDLLTNTILLAQGKPLFFDLAPKDKMVLFSDTLQLSRWDTRSKAADLAMAEAEEDVRGFESDKRADEAANEELAELLAETKTKAERWVTEYRVSDRALKDVIAELNEQIDAKQHQLDGARLREDGAATEARAAEREDRKLAGELAKVQANLASAESALCYTEGKLEDCEREIAELASSKTCPTCGQAIKPTNIAKHKAHLLSQREKYTGIVKAGVPVSVRNAVVVLTKQHADNLAALTNFKELADAAEAEVERLFPEVATLRAKLGEAKRRLKEEKTNPYTQEIAGLRLRIDNNKRSIKALETKIVAASQRAERNNFWVKGFKDIKLQLIEGVLDELQLVTNSMLEEVGLVDWEVRYDIERETKSGSVQRALHVLINSPESKGYVKWESWSGGEQQRLRLIGALALSDVLLGHAGVQTNLEILDEPALYWSTEGVQELCGFLAERARQTERSIFYVEHQAVESTHFSNVLTVIRDKDGAYIE